GADAPLGLKLEPQRAGHKGWFDVADGTAIAQPLRFAAALGPQRMSVLMVAKILITDGACRNEAVGAGLVELDEQSGARDPGNVTFERRTDPIGQKMREQAIEGLALRFHGAPPGGRNLRSNFAQAGNILLVRKRARPELQCAHQTAVDDQIGIATDRRGEMGITAQVEAKMAIILRRIFRLCLR